MQPSANSVKATIGQKTKSANLSEQISAVIPGGINSPFRSFTEVGGHEIFFEKAFGSKLYDVDGKIYIDYLGAWGPAILGHSHPQVIEACERALRLGAVFGTPHELELEMAQRIVDIFPSIEKVRFVSSGTEAVMSAIRLARGVSGKNIIVMFEGNYHGHSDATLASQGHSSSSGILEESAQQTVLAKYNDLESLENVLELYRGKIAAIIIEPVAGSMGVIPPAPGFLHGVRSLCTKYSTLLIFDEVLTGLRVGYGGAQLLYGVIPDITCFGKALGGGMPIGAYGASQAIMDELQPLGKVYQAGTFSGNPVSMAGGIEVLKLLNSKVYIQLEKRSKQLFDGLEQTIQILNAPIVLQRVGSMFSILFTEKPVHNFQDSLLIDTQSFAAFFHYLLDHGIYMPPSAVDAACVSAAHSEEDVQITIDVCKQALQSIY